MSDNYTDIDDHAWQMMATTGKLGDLAITYLPTTSSTNDIALRLGKSGTASGHLVVAESQTAGRGRLGRCWQSPAAMGLYFSLILRPHIDPADLPKITLATGVALSLAVTETTGLTAKIKWPNDLLLNGKKFAGILTESAAVYDTNPLVVIGVGVNVLTPPSFFPTDLQDKATSIFAGGGKLFTRSTILLAMVSQINTVITVMERGGFADILAQWRRMDASLGRTLTWVTPDSQLVTGESLGPDADGVMHIRAQNGKIHRVISGDINLATDRKTKRPEH